MLKFERILTCALRAFPRSWRSFPHAIKNSLGEKVWVRGIIASHLGVAAAKILFTGHHAVARGRRVSHRADPSRGDPDRRRRRRVGDAHGRPRRPRARTARTDITLLREIRFPHSLGMLYSTFTAYLGFAVNEDEYKVMGLAAYGRPTMIDAGAQADPAHARRRVRARARVLRVPDDGRRVVFVEVRRPVRAAAPSLRADRSRDRRRPALRRLAPPASSACSRTRSSTSRARSTRKRGLPDLCFGGGVALNGVANARILAESGFERVFVPPAPGDAGCALGAALYADRIYFRNPDRDVPDHPFWGPAVDAQQLARAAREDGQLVDELDDAVLIERIADDLAAGRIVGWMEGACEFGPRALGHRSLLAAPHSIEMRDRLNRDIKHREEFRPFAPVVTRRGRGPIFRSAAGRRAARRASCRACFRCGPNGEAGSPPSRTSTGRRGCRCSSATWRRGCTRCSRRTGAAPAFRCCSTRRSTSPASRSSTRALEGYTDVPPLRHRRARRRARLS